MRIQLQGWTLKGNLVTFKRFCVDCCVTIPIPADQLTDDIKLDSVVVAKELVKQLYRTVNIHTLSGIDFYREYSDLKKRKPDGNCVAIIKDNICPDGSIEAIGAVFDHANSVCAGTAVSPAYLKTRCVKILESEARDIHPALFDYLDDDSFCSEESDVL